MDNAKVGATDTPLSVFSKTKGRIAAMAGNFHIRKLRNAASTDSLAWAGVADVRSASNPAGPMLNLGWRSAARRVLDRIPYYSNYVRKDPTWLLMFVCARFVFFRRLAPRVWHRQIQNVDVQDTVFDHVDIDGVVSALRDQGIYPGLQIPAPMVAKIRQFASETVCYANLDPALPFMPADHAQAEETFGKPILVGHLFGAIDRCPEVVAIKRDPALRVIASRYLGSDPYLINARLWWSFPTTNYDEEVLTRVAQDRFHFDLNDWRSLKFFFYLTDVDENAGSHVYVRESHRIRPLRQQFSLLVVRSTEEIHATYGEQRVSRIHGPAGFGFAEDPFGFHMGTVPRSKRRLILEVEYGLSSRTAIEGGAISTRARKAR